MPGSRSTPFLGLGLPDHGDERLNRRQVAILGAFARSAGSQQTAPAVIGSNAGAEAYYRLVRNKRVDVGAVIKPHVDEVFMQQTEGSLLVAHDSTNIRHSTADDADDMYDLGGGDEGYVAHVSLLIDEQHAAPIGVGHLEVVDRTGEAGHEPGRWLRGVAAVATGARGHEQVIHVCDREGDSYPLMNFICQLAQDFVIRESQDRLVIDDDGNERRISVAIEQVATVGALVVEVPARTADKPRPKDKKRTDRSERQASLEVKVLRTRLKRPARRAGEDLPEELPVSFVVARELNPPKGEAPIDWRLWTTLPVRGLDDAARVTSIYKARWRIEELFKALKTGCGFGSTRFESRATSSRALALQLPIAVGLLRLRALGTVGQSTPATKVLDPTQLEVLRTFDKKLPAMPTASDAMWAIARLGGFLPQNKRAGWLVLGRGLTHLLALSLAWKVARGEAPSAMERATVEM